jgi:hypothetical protein
VGHADRNSHTDAVFAYRQSVDEIAREALI